jgi:protein involved in polysaccharide export with SLBB domain
VLFVTACNATGRPLSDVAPEINAALDGSPSVLGPGDVLTIRFEQHTEWDHESLVLPDGRASFLGVGHLQVAGLSAEMLETELENAYQAILTEPQLTVLTKSLAPRTAAVLGEVDEPGAVTLDGRRLDLLQALAEVGGHDVATALLKNVMLLRWMPSEGRRRAWQIDARPEQWLVAEPVLLQPYDIVYVPPKNVVMVNIWVDQYLRAMIPFPRLFVIQ